MESVLHSLFSIYSHSMSAPLINDICTACLQQLSCVFQQLACLFIRSCTLKYFSPPMHAGAVISHFTTTCHLGFYTRIHRDSNLPFRWLKRLYWVLRLISHIFAMARFVAQILVVHYCLNNPLTHMGSQHDDDLRMMSVHKPPQIALCSKCIILMANKTQLLSFFSFLTWFRIHNITIWMKLLRNLEDEPK